MKRKLLSAAFAFIGMTAAWADTSLLKSEDGWTKISNFPENISDYYYAIVDDTKDLMLSFEDGHNQSTVFGYKTMVYRTSQNAKMNPGMLWEITPNTADNESNWSIKSAVEPSLYLQTEQEYKSNKWEPAPWYCRTHDQSVANNTWCKWTFAYANEKWTIQNGRYPDKGYIGAWNKPIANGENVAANVPSNDERMGYFQIYSIKKSDVDITGISNATSSTPFNYTYKIANPNAIFGVANGWTGEGIQTRKGDPGFDGKAGFFEFCDWNKELWSGSISQTITGLPDGKYRLRVAAQLSSDNVELKIAIDDSEYSIPGNGASNGNILSSGVETTVGDPNAVAGWKYSTVESIVKNNELTIKFSSSGNAVNRWANVDNVELYLLSPSLSAVATALPEDGKMTKDTWYYIDINVAANDYAATANVLNDIVYTSDGSIILEDASKVTDTFGENNNTLEATRYYVKSSSDNNSLVLKANTYVYIIGDVTETSLADGSYIQGLTTMTFTLGEAASNDNEAKLTLQGTPKVSLKKNDVLIAEGNLSIEDKILTASFDGVTLEPVSSYIVTLPADVVVYDKNTEVKNNAKSITLNTPALFDGIYYIETAEGQYISRGGDSNTEAAIDNYGIPAKFVTDVNNVTTILFVDHNRNLFGGSESIYTDKNYEELEKEGEGKGARIYWTVGKDSKGYTLRNNNANKFIAPGESTETTHAYAAIYSDDAYEWTLEDAMADTHKIKMQALKDDQAKTVASSVGVEANTQEAFSALLDKYYDKNVETVNKTNIDDEAYQLSNKEIYTGTKEVAPGLYKVSVNAFERFAGIGTVVSAGGAACLAYVYANDEKVQLCSLTEYYITEPQDHYVSGGDGKYYVNDRTSSKEVFANGKYNNEVFVWVDADDGKETGTIKFGIMLPTVYKANNSQWIYYGNFTLTRYYQSASMNITDAEYATFIAPFDVEIPEGVTASTVTAADEQTGELTLAECEETIPAYTPVILYSENKVEETFTGFGAPTEKETYTDESGYLTGYLGNDVMDAPVGSYVLQNQNDVVAFYKVGSSIQPKIGKNRAYLSASTGNAIKAFYLNMDGTATAIESLDMLTSGEYDSIYTATGVKVDALQKGLNIVVKGDKSYKIYVK